MAATRLDGALQELIADAEFAGAAMACRYSSSAEFEAALIDERRRTGVYDLPRRHHPLLWSALAVAAVMAVLLAF